MIGTMSFLKQVVTGAQYALEEITQYGMLWAHVETLWPHQALHIYAQPTISYLTLVTNETMINVWQGVMQYEQQCKESWQDPPKLKLAKSEFLAES